MKKVLKILGWIVIPYIMIFVFWKKINKPGRIAGVIYALVALIIAISSGSNSGNTANPTSQNAAVASNTTTTTSATTNAKTDTNNTDAQKKADEAAAAKKKADEAAAQKAAQEAAAKKQAEETPKQKMMNSIKTLISSKQAFDTGNYVKGDIPAGDYAFVSFQGSGKYYSENDTANNIIDNENFDSFGYVSVHGSGNLETQGLLVNTAAFPQLGVTGAKQIYEILNDVQNYAGAGFYKVGADLPAGKYTVQSQGEGYVAALSGPVGNREIIDNQNFNGRYSESVTNGQFLSISRGTITQ